MTRRLFVALLCLPLAALAQTSAVPGLINYQGRVADASGTPIGATAPVTRLVAFRIYDAATGGTRLYSEQQTVAFSGGEFSVLIGNGTAIAADAGNPHAALSAAVFAGAARFLGVTIDDGDGNLANETELAVRQRLTAAAFVLRAQVAESVAAGGVNAAAFAPGSVGAAALAPGIVGSAKLAASAVGTAQVADAAVTAAKLAGGAVTSAALADGAVTAPKIAAGAIDATKIADNSITLAALAANAVDSAKIADGTIAATDLAAGAVNTAALAAGAVTAAKLAADAVGTAKIAAGAVATADLAAGAVDATKIAAAAVGLRHFTPATRDTLGQGRYIYNQGLDPDYVTKRTKGWSLFPIDIGDFANDADGCVVTIIAQHNITPSSWRTLEAFLYLEQDEFTNNPDVPNRLWLRSHYTYDSGVTSTTSRLGVTTWNTTGRDGAGSNVFATLDNWVDVFSYFPGSRRSSNPAPFNANQDPNASNLNNGGPPVTTALASIVAGPNQLTFTLANPHPIQVGDSVTLAGITGAGNPNGTFTVTDRPDRLTFSVALAGATGAYTGGTVTHQPTYNKFRLWVAVHPDVSARVIVSDR